MADTGKTVVWCDLNDEAVCWKLIPMPCRSATKTATTAGRKSGAFSDGQIRVLVLSKQKIAGWGMNWQHCVHATDFPSHSFEATTKRFAGSWRFGQQSPVR